MMEVHTQRGVHTQRTVVHGVLMANVMLMSVSRCPHPQSPSLPVHASRQSNHVEPPPTLTAFNIAGL